MKNLILKKIERIESHKHVLWTNLDKAVRGRELITVSNLSELLLKLRSQQEAIESLYGDIMQSGKF